MSLHSYSRCWLHLIWGTHNRQKLLHKEAAARVSRYLNDYAANKQIYARINYVNPDHVHILIDLPTGLAIEDVVQLLKGSSSHWINANDVIEEKFAWGRGYGAFSVSESNVNSVAEYIATQEQHHRLRTFSEELKEFIERRFAVAWGRKPLKWLLPRGVFFHRPKGPVLMKDDCFAQACDRVGRRCG